MPDVKINERGRRIGESHPRAVLTDHEVALLMNVLEERERLIAEKTAEGLARAVIDALLTARGLSYRLIAEKFEIHKYTVAKIATGQRRCQTPATTKPCP